ncbi:MAG: hypothetical protein ACKOC9_04495, partial [Alphaproteobacteria bacterium]
MHIGMPSALCQHAGAETDAPANPNTPGTTRQNRDAGAFARTAAESASASAFLISNKAPHVMA